MRLGADTQAAPRASRGTIIGILPYRKKLDAGPLRPQSNAFSKKLENHVHALAVFLMFYNFCRIHQTLRVTPAMEAGIADHVWTVEEIVGLVEEEDVVILR